MALPSSGVIGLSDVNTNIGVASNTYITLNDTPVRLLSNGDTTTNPVTMNGLYGKSWVWTSNFSQSGFSTYGIYSNTTDSSGNYYYMTAGSSPLVSVIKVNPVGIMQWATRLDGASGYAMSGGGTGRSSIVVAASGNIYCAVRLSLSSYPYSTVHGVVKLNASGVVQWSSFLSSPADYYSNMSIGVDSSENVYVLNYNRINASSTSDDGACFAKYNSSGTLQWQKQLQLGYASTLGSAMVVDATNNYIYFAGALYDSSLSLRGGLLGKYDTSLSPVWQQLMSSALQQYYGCSVNPTTQSVCALTSDLTAVLHNSSGAQQWQKTIASGSTYYDIAMDASDNSYVCFKQIAVNNTGVCVKLNSSGAISAQIKVVPTGVSNSTPSPPTISGSYFYSGCDTITSALPVNGGTVYKIPNTLSTSGTYGRVTFSAPSYTVSSASYSFSSVSTTIASTSFTQVTSIVTGVDITSAYTKAFSAI